MGIPIYMRIQQYITAKIRSGEWAEDSLLPTEVELSKQFGCSRITVTTALRELAKDGAIYRIQGKGTFVSRRNTSRNVYRTSGLSHFGTKLEDLTIPGEHKCVGIYVSSPTEEVSNLLRLGPEQRVITIDRIKYVEGTPFALEKLYLPELLYAPVIEKHLETQHFDELSVACGVTPGKSFISSEPVLCDAQIGQFLNISEGTPILRFCIELQDMQGNPVACEFVFVDGKQERVEL